MCRPYIISMFGALFCLLIQTISLGLVFQNDIPDSPQTDRNRSPENLVTWNLEGYPRNQPLPTKGKIRSHEKPPSIQLSQSQINFGYSTQDQKGSFAQYEIVTKGLTDSLKLSASYPFLLSVDNHTYVNELRLEQPGSSPIKIWVTHDTDSAGFFQGSISHSSTGAAYTTLEVITYIMDPKRWWEPFDDSCEVGLPKEWILHSSIGEEKWACSNLGRNENNPRTNAPFGIQMNGFIPGVGITAQEAWLISPVFDLNNFQFPLFSFWSRVAFGGPRLRLKISTNYYEGDPNLATWETLPDRFAKENSWSFSQPINLTGYRNEKIRLAFVYESSPEKGAARWSIDDIELNDSASPPAPYLRHDIGQIDYWHFANDGSTPEHRDFSFDFSDAFAELSIYASPAFEFSKDGVNFLPELLFSENELKATQRVHVKFSAPSKESRAYGSPVYFESDTLIQKAGYLSASTIPGEKTLDIVTWNVEWFGSREYGPEDVSLQRKRVGEIIKRLDADLFALQEIVDNKQMELLVEENPAYAFVLSPAASREPEGYENAQKLAFLYKKSVIEPISHRVMLEEISPELLTNYPSDPNRFWASGRLPFLLEAWVNLEGKTKRICFINIHARSNGGGESASNPRYAMRKYDVQVLKDSLDQHYLQTPIVLLGDFNDDLAATVADHSAPTVGTTESSFLAFTNDSLNYNPITLSLSHAGLRSFPTFPNVIDNILINKLLEDKWLKGSERIVNPLDWIPDYLSTTSDHLPVMNRFGWGCEKYQGVITGKDWVCSPSDTLVLSLTDQPFELLGWEESTDKGVSYHYLPGSKAANPLKLSNLTGSKWMRAIVKTEGCNQEMYTDPMKITYIKLPKPPLEQRRNYLKTLVGGFTYHWRRNDSLMTTTLEPSLEFSSAGIYQVGIEHPLGCLSWSDNLRLMLSGIGPKLHIYPNPAKDSIKLTHNKLSGIANLELRNVSGALLYSASTNRPSLEIDLNLLKPGWYWLSLTWENGERSIQRFMVTK
ncbi:endonuclease/exonuclease/phosphatase family protein [Pleomorphovibrio marinus]|uniref:endonuclease/exonuclease/phosphatase family protein n=1 Tax=Pleomorphovibrio marinus TaxID=2164132 RepID=UPI000E0B63F6|nr:endonuclease/exonuclease/phosphatase family protein [Pleomorphovibrio marinus]